MLQQNIDSSLSWHPVGLFKLPLEANEIGCTAYLKGIGCTAYLNGQNAPYFPPPTVKTRSDA